LKPQKSNKTRQNSEKAKAPKSLGARYAELLKLREAVERTQSDLKLPSATDPSKPRQDRALPHH
jgi:hypothetical protein